MVGAEEGGEDEVGVATGTFREAERFGDMGIGESVALSIYV